MSRHVSALLPFAIIASGLSVNIGPSRIYNSLEPTERGLAFEETQTRMNAIGRNRMSAIMEVIREPYKRLGDAATLEEFTTILDEIRSRPGIIPVDEVTYDGLASLVEDMVTRLGSTLTDSEQETEKTVIFTSMVNAMSEVLQEKVSAAVSELGHIAMLKKIALAADLFLNDEQPTDTGNGVATGTDIQEESQATAETEVYPTGSVSAGDEGRTEQS